MAYPVGWYTPMSNKQWSKFMSINGFDLLLANYGAEMEKIGITSRAGLIRVAKFIQRETESVAPLVPIGKTAVLHHSFEIHNISSGVKGNRKHGIMFGYSANYALWVHEMIGAHFKREGAGAHWFRAAIERNHDVIMQILIAETKI